jgi:hypothetical protein
MITIVVDIVEPGVGIWGQKEVAGLQDPVLQKLAKDLPGTMLEAWSSNTNKVYQSSFKKWATWADAFPEISALPARPIHVCLYLVALGQQQVSVATLNSVLAAIAWAHRIAGMESPSENKTVKITMEGLRRRLAKPRVTCSPITAEHILQIVQKTNLEDLQDMRVTSFILLSFAGFFRCSEVCAIRSEHVVCSQLIWKSFYRILRTINSNRDKQFIWQKRERVLVQSLFFSNTLLLLGLIWKFHNLCSEMYSIQKVRSKCRQ